MNAQTKAYHDFAMIVLSECASGVAPGRALECAADLWNLARPLHRLYLHESNRPLRPAEKTRIKRLEDAIKSVAEHIGLVVHLNDDARGFAVKLATPKSEKANTMGGREDGWGFGFSE